MPIIKIAEKLETEEIIKNLLSRLSKKEKDIISRRFGLRKKEKETLEKVGKIHSLTRERIRQIENASIKKVKQLKEMEEGLSGVKNRAEEILKEHGGFAEKEYLFHLLNTSSPIDYGSSDYLVEKNHYDFLFSRVLEDHFEEIKNLEKFKKFYKLKHETLDHLEELAEDLLVKIREMNRTIKTKDLFDLLSLSPVYEKHKEKIYIPSADIDVSGWWKEELYDEDNDLVNNNKVVYSLLQALKGLGQNKFGFWGARESGEIKPKTINDKIYLVLKNEGKPMHFVQIAEKINNIGFDSKVANPATVHNELILDERYVLVGRGIYGLKEWGYKEGIVADVIQDILLESGPLTKDEITEKVLENRLVKKTTVSLALMNKEKFERIGDKYQVKK